MLQKLSRLSKSKQNWGILEETRLEETKGNTAKDNVRSRTRTRSLAGWLAQSEWGLHLSSVSTMLVLTSALWLKCWHLGKLGDGDKRTLLVPSGQHLSLKLFQNEKFKKGIGLLPHIKSFKKCSNLISKYSICFFAKATQPSPKHYYLRLNHRRTPLASLPALASGTIMQIRLISLKHLLT